MKCVQNCFVAIVFCCAACSGKVTSYGPEIEDASTDIADATPDKEVPDGPVLRGPSCAQGLNQSCGWDKAQDCCAASIVPGGSFWGDYDGISYKSKSWKVTVSPFYLDQFEISVGRFRAFVEAYPSSRPKAGDGSHPLIANSGWQEQWQIASSQEELKSNLRNGQCAGPRLWTEKPGPNENRAMNCVTWYELFAFCAWDGGRLPTEAEWNFAAAGGDEQRVFPWSTPPDSSTVSLEYATYSEGGQFLHEPSAVGAHPKGRGRWNQYDLAGNVAEELLDVGLEQRTGTCVDCAILSSPQAKDRRALRGGGFGGEAEMLVARRNIVLPSSRASYNGARCARDH